jgi:heat shock protein HslJ
MQLGEVAQNFEGEADPNRMTLGMKTWNWLSTTYNNDTKITPKINTFTLTLKDGKMFSSTTDCNGVSGEYVTSGKKITFTKMVSTMMYCEGSQEQDFTKMLNEVKGYTFTSKGELVLMLNYDSGSMVFK